MLNDQRLEEAAEARREAFQEKLKLPGYRKGFEKFMKEANANAAAAEAVRKAR